MKILAIDTSGLVCGVALVDHERTIGEYNLDNRKTHSQALMPMIDALLQVTETDLTQIDYIACAAGPGSFTGLRIGAAAVKALAQGANKQIVKVPALDALAYNIFNTGSIIIPMMDARRGQVYTAFYRWDQTKLVRLSDYMADDVDSVIAATRAYTEKKIVLGDGAAVYLDRISAFGADFLCPPANMNRQRAASVGHLAIDMVMAGEKLFDYKEYLPFYIRKPQAEREYERKHGHDKNCTHVYGSPGSGV